MNDLIQQLAEQAELKLDDLPDNVFVPLGKLTDLIVKECLNEVERLREVSRTEVSDDPTTRMIMTGTCNIILNQLKAHFGVKDDI